MKIEYDKLWQGSSVGESARLIPVRSRVRISPLLFFIAYSRGIRSARAFSPNRKMFKISHFALLAHGSLSAKQYSIVLLRHSPLYFNEWFGWTDSVVILGIG